MHIMQVYMIGILYTSHCSVGYFVPYRYLFFEKFKMADLCQFLCKNQTLLLINHQSLQLGSQNFQSCCCITLHCFLHNFGTVTASMGSPEVMKGHEIGLFPYKSLVPAARLSKLSGLLQYDILLLSTSFWHCDLIYKVTRGHQRSPN